MKNIKKLKSYGKAVAGSALLIGATVAGASAVVAQDSGSSGDATLQDYPQPFVDDEGMVDTSIVVGTDGKQADVVSAVDIAGDLGNQAFSEETVEGGVAGFDGATEDEVKVGASSFDLSADKSDYTKLVRKTVEDDDENEIFVTESISATGIDNHINGTETEFRFTQDDISYTAKYSPGFGEGDELTILGEEYELVNIVDDQELEMGSSMDTEVQVGDSFEHGPYTVEVTGQTQGDNPEPVVRVSEGEETLETQSLGEDDDPIEVDNGDFSVEADTVIFYEGGDTDITLTTTYQDMVLEEGEDLPMDDNYKVSTIKTNTDDTNVTEVSVANQVQTVEEPEDDDEVSYIEQGESFEGPNGYFELANRGLTNEALTEVEFGSGLEVTFDDVNNQEHTIDMDEDLFTGTINATGDAQIHHDTGEDVYVGVPGANTESDQSSVDYYPVQITDIESESTDDNVTAVTVKHNEYEETVERDGDLAGQTLDTGYGFDLKINFTEIDSGAYAVISDPDQEDVTTTFTTMNGAELGFTAGVSGTAAVNDVSDISDASDVDAIRLNETAGSEAGAPTANITALYDDEGTNEGFSDVDDGELSAISVVGQNVINDEEDGDSTLSSFGSSVELDSASSATVMYPDEQRYTMAGLGSASGEVDTEGTVSYEPTGFPAGTGTLDEDVSNSERDQNMILVGGPEVNGLTADLADEGDTYNSTWYENNQGVGALDLVNDAFSDGYSALVVAGWQADDTSAAADYLVDYNPETDSALEGLQTAQVNTDSGELVE